VGKRVVFFVRNVIAAEDRSNGKSAKLSSGIPEIAVFKEGCLMLRGRHIGQLSYLILYLLLEAFAKFGRFEHKNDRRVSKSPLKTCKKRNRREVILVL